MARAPLLLVHGAFGLGGAQLLPALGTALIAQGHLCHAPELPGDEPPPFHPPHPIPSLLPHLLILPIPPPTAAPGFPPGIAVVPPAYEPLCSGWGRVPLSAGSRASIQTALRTLLAVPWPSQRDVSSALQLLAVLQWVLSFLLLGE